MNEWMKLYSSEDSLYVHVWRSELELFGLSPSLRELLHHCPLFSDSSCTRFFLSCICSFFVWHCAVVCFFRTLVKPILWYSPGGVLHSGCLKAESTAVKADVGKNVLSLWGDWKCETGIIGTIKNAGVENAGPSSYGKPNTYLLRHTQHDLHALAM